MFYGDVASGFTIYLQDLGTDFVPTAGNTLGHLVGHRLSTNQAARRLPDGTIEDLGTLGGNQSRAAAISDDGRIIVGWARNSNGVQNSFRFENAMMRSPSGLIHTNFPNQGIGLDADNNVYVNLQAASQSVWRWNAAGSLDIVLNNAQASGANQAGQLVGKNTDGTTFLFNGATTPIPPPTYNPVGGISDAGISAGALGSVAGFHTPGAAAAAAIPGIAALGSPSVATGINAGNLIVGNAAAGVFLYDVAQNSLVDLGAGTLQGANAFYLLELNGITDDNIFFGKYIDFAGAERYFRGSLTATDFGISGDFDGNGKVDGRDFLIWQRNVSVGDLTDWQGNYGVGGIGATHSLTIGVPEPGSLAVLCWLTVAMGMRAAAPPPNCERLSQMQPLP